MKSPETETQVKFYHEVARANGSMVTVSELLSLLPGMTSAAELEETIAVSPLLRSRWEINSGYVVERGGESEVASALRENAKSRMAASSNMRTASVFFGLLRLNPFKMVSVSGSTSYSSASRSKDVDFFCVAGRGELWLSLTHGLIIARAFALLHRDAPQICFSCVMDESFAQSLFRSPRGALFARDALELKIFRGEALYETLLQQAPWIAQFYPALRREGSYEWSEVPPSGKRASIFRQVVNRFLFLIVGGFIKLKSEVYNRRFVSLGQTENEFTVRSGEDHLIYESNHYIALKRKYDAAFSGQIQTRW